MEKRRVLVVDDSPENLKAAKEFFYELSNSIDLEVFFLQTAREALEFLDKEQVDMVITDLSMEEEFSGFLVVEKSIEKGVLPLLVSGYVFGDHHDHIRMFPLLPKEEIPNIIFSRNTRKSDKETWYKIWQYYNTLIEFDKEIISSLKRYRNFIKKDVDGLAKILLKSLYYDIKYVR